MNKQLQIELWPECRCNRCDFCNLVLSSELRGDGLQSNPNIILSPEKKNVFIERAIYFLDTVDWSLYDTLLIRGGEVFNHFDKSILPLYGCFIQKISSLIKEGEIKKLFLITSLKYPFEYSLLHATLDMLLMSGIDVSEKVLVGTSWDVRYRFTEKSLSYWKENIKILDEKSIPIHITSILTQSFIEGFLKESQDIIDVMDRDFDFIAAQGKPELLHLEKFFPNRKDCMDFLIRLKDSKYNPIWYRLLHQNHRRAESIFFTEHDNLQIRDLENFKTVLEKDSAGVLKCGHPIDYANYADSDACFLCDLATISRM